LKWTPNELLTQYPVLCHSRSIRKVLAANDLSQTSRKGCVRTEGQIESLDSGSVD